MSWTDPQGISGVMIRRAIGDKPPARPGDGVLVTIASGTATSYTDGGLDGGVTYSYSLFAENTAGNYARPASASVTVPAASGPVAVCGHIKGRVTWSPQSAPEYDLTCPVIIDPGAQLRIDPGADVRGASDGGIQVDGSLDVAGTSQDPVNFGGLDSQVAGSWPGISSGDQINYLPGSVHIANAVIADAGGGTPSSPLQAAVDIQPVATLVISDSVIRNCTGAGILARSVNPAPDISGVTVDDCGNGIIVDHGYYSDQSDPIVMNNSITRVRGTAITVDARLTPSQLSGNTGSDDGVTAMLMSGPLTEDLTLPTPGLPWVVNNPGYHPYTQDDFSVPAGITLTLGPGTVLKFVPGSASEIDVLGTLQSTATAADPAVLTSFRDDTVGGDTNGDADATAPAAGDWLGIQAGTSGVGASIRTVDLRHTVVAYDQQLETWHTRLTLIDDTFHDATYGVIAHAYPPVTEDIEDCVFSHVVMGMWVETVGSNDPGQAPTIAGNEVDDAQVPISVASQALVLDKLRGNFGTADVVSGMFISGQLVSDFDMEPTPQEFPWVISGDIQCPYTQPVSYEPCVAGLTIAHGVTLRLGPGAVLKAGRDTLLNLPPEPQPNPILDVAGTLDVEGSAADPASLTSLSDDSIGGDTNGDGTATVPQSGDWGGIDSGYDNNGTVVIDNAEISFAEGVELSGHGNVTLTDDVFTDLGTGIDGGAVIDLSPSGGAVDDVEGVSLVGGAANGIAVVSEDIAGEPIAAPPTVKNCSVTGVAGAAFVIEGPNLIPDQLSADTALNDGMNVMEVGGVLDGDVTLPAVGVPWVLGTDPSVYGVNGSGLVIGPGATMTLSPGSVTKVADTPGYNGQNPIVVEGTLRAEGTSEAPVVITALTDDTAGGDLNGDGTASVPAAGSWAGITASHLPGSPAATVQLDHATIRYADDVGATGVSHLVLSNDVLEHFLYSGVVANVDSGGQIDIENTLVDDVGGDGIDAQAVSEAASDAPVVSGDTVNNAAGRAIVVAGPIDPATIGGNVGTGDGVNAVEMSGTLETDFTVPAQQPQPDQLPLELGPPPAIGLPDSLDGATLVVPPGVTLTMDAGSVLKADPVRSRFAPEGAPMSIAVEGNLVSDATSDTPAHFTSISDDATGGDTNGDGDGSRPQAEDWIGVVADPLANHQPPTIDLSNTDIEFATTALTVPSGVATVTGTIQNDTHGVAGPPKDQDGQCSNGTVTATPVWWGTPTGPAPYGTGPDVSGCVDVQGWDTAP